MKKLVAIGDGWTTTTSMPRLRTSAAMDVANMVKKALVLAYMLLSGFGTNPEKKYDNFLIIKWSGRGLPAEEEVNATSPVCFAASILLIKWCVMGMLHVALHS